MQLMINVLDDAFEAQLLTKDSTNIRLEQDRCYARVIFNYQFPLINDFDDDSIAGKEFAVEMTIGIPHYGISVLWLNGEVSTLITRYNTVVENMKLVNGNIDYDEYTLCREFVAYLDKCGATVNIKD